MKTTVFTGTATALVTPFDPDGSINFDSYRALIERQIAAGVDALVAVGTTGENASVSAQEHEALMKCAVETAKGRVPVICSTGSNDTAYCIKTSLAAKSCGADALLLVTPYYNKTSQSGLVKHYHAILDAVGLPAILYHIPSRTGLSVKAETFKVLSKHPLAVGLKEASGDVSYAEKVMDLCGDDLPVYSGNDDLTLPLMALGAKGVISVFSNILPREMKGITDLCLENDFFGAREAAKKYQRLMRLLFSDVNPVPVKAAMGLMGLCSSYARPPLFEMETAPFEELKEELTRLELVKQ